MVNKVISLIFIFLGFVLFLIIAFIGYDNVNQKLSDYNFYKGKVIKKGIVKSDKNSQIFFFKISDLNQKFGVYRMNKNYSTLDNEIKIGEEIKVYYQPINSKSEKYNLNVVQIEKNNLKLLKQSEHRIKYSIMMILGILASIYMLYMAFCIIKYGKFDNPIPTIF